MLRSFERPIVLRRGGEGNLDDCIGGVVYKESVSEPRLVKLFTENQRAKCVVN